MYPYGYRNSPECVKTVHKFWVKQLEAVKQSQIAAQDFCEWL